MVKRKKKEREKENVAQESIHEKILIFAHR